MYWRGLIFRKGSSQMKTEVTLSADEVALCACLLSQRLMHVSNLLGNEVDGDKLTKKGRRELMRFSLRLQLTLMTLGMTSSELERIVKDFSAV